MFEKIGRLAEAAATNVSVSRRGFLGRLGQSALGFVGVLAGLSATAASAQSGGSYVCCTWNCSNPYRRHLGFTKLVLCLPPGTNCYNLATCGPFGGTLIGNKTVNSCNGCK
jgi:hypothetical protein